MVKSTSSSDGERGASEPPVSYPSAHVVQEMRRIFRVFVEAPNRFHPADVWGVLFYSRLEFCGDFVKWGKPVLVDDRGPMILEACKFWVNEARAEMVAGGYWPRLELPPLMALEYTIQQLDAWFTGIFNPVLDGEEVESISSERALQIKQLWAWVLDNVQKSGQVTRESVMYAARRALQSVGIEPEDEEEVKRLAEELFRGHNQDKPMTYMTKGKGNWRVSWRHLRDNSPTMRKLRYRKRKDAKPLSLDAPLGDADGPSLASTVPDREAQNMLEMLANRYARDAVDAVDTFRRVCAERAEVPPRRKDDVVGPLVRKHLFAIARGDVQQVEIAKAHGVDKGNFSRAYKRELKATLVEVQRRLAG